MNINDRPQNVFSQLFFVVFGKTRKSAIAQHGLYFHDSLIQHSILIENVLSLYTMEHKFNNFESEEPDVLKAFSHRILLSIEIFRWNFPILSKQISRIWRTISINFRAEFAYIALAC